MDKRNHQRWALFSSGRSGTSLRKGCAWNAGHWGLALYTGATFHNDQYAQVKFVTHSAAGGGTGPCVRVSSNGNAYCYAADIGSIIIWNNDVWYQTLTSSCPVPATGDMVRISAVGTTVSCKDVTTGASASATDSTYWLNSGVPSVLVHQRSSTVYALSTFQADCVPSCGGGSTVAATPTFSPGAGSYGSSQTVTISDVTPASTIYFTTDGSTPTTGSAIASSSIAVSTSETLKAIAAAAGYVNSTVASAAYIITSAVATPTFNPAGGTYGSARSVTISTATAVATIYYTIDGTTPTTSSSVYSGAVTVSTSETLKALGVKSGFTNSAVGSAAYVITGGTKTVTGVAISPWCGAVQLNGSIQFSAQCTYSDATQDNCSFIGGATWKSSSLNLLTVSSTGLATQTGDPGAYWSYGYYAVVTAGGFSDKAYVALQRPGDTFYQYPTPDYRGFKDSQTGVPLPLNVTVGSTVTKGSAINVNSAHGGDSTATPFQAACNWSGSNTSVATVNRYGLTTGVSPGSVTISCGRAGSAVFGSSTSNGWIAPGNVISLSVVAAGVGNTPWYVLPGGGTIYSATNTNGQCSGKVNQTYVAAGGSG